MTKTTISNIRAVLTIGIAVLLVALTALAPVQKANAADLLPKLYLDPLKQVLALNANVSVPIRVNTGGKPANVASITITYPSELLKFVSISYQGSAFGGLVEESISTPGTIKLTRYATPAGSTVKGDVLFANLTLKISALGVADINLLGGVSQLLNDGIGVNVTLGGVNLNVTTKPNPDGPTVTKPTAPTPTTQTPQTTNKTTTTPKTTGSNNKGTGIGSVNTEEPPVADAASDDDKKDDAAAKKDSRLKRILGIAGTSLGMFGLGAGATYAVGAKKYGWGIPFAAGAVAGGLAGGALAAGKPDEDEDKDDENKPEADSSEAESPTPVENPKPGEVVSADAGSDHGKTTPIPVVAGPTEEKSDQTIAELEETEKNKTENGDKA